MKPYDEIQIISSPADLNSQKGIIIKVTGHYYSVSNKVISLINCLANAQNKDLGIDLFIDNSQSLYTRNQIEIIIEKVINPLFKSPVEKKGHSGFIFRRTLIPSHIVNNIANRFSFLFNKVMVLPIVLLFIILNGYYFIQPVDIFNYSSRIGLDGIFLIGILIIFSSILHEFGHAAACARYNISSGEIGFGVYLNFPLLYTDVSGIWNLPQKKRHVVNFAGLYFQTILLIIIDCIYFISSNEIARFLILSITLSFVITINPFLKFDGYWIVSDILNIPNLREHMIIWLRRKFTKSQEHQLSLIDFLSKRKKILFISYSICATLFILIYFLYIIPRVLITSGISFISDIHLLASYITSYASPPFSIVKNVISYLIFVLTILYLCWNIIKLFYNNKNYKFSDQFKHKI